MMLRKTSLLPVLCFITWIGLVSLAGAANEVFLSNDTAESEATYVIQFESGVKGNIDKIRVTLPPGSNAANATLGRLFIGDKGFEGDDEHKKDIQLSLDGPDTLVIDLKDDRSVKVGTKILVELFNLNNPVAGNNHAIDVSTIGKKGNVLEVIPSIAYSTFSDATQLTAGAGISISGSSPNFTITNTGDPDPNDDITSLVGQNGITISASGNSRTIGRDASVIQSRVTGNCPPGESIRQINENGTVVCEADDVGAGGITGTGTANTIAKFTGATTIGNSVIVESGGNVGIGTTTSLLEKLEIAGNIKMSGTVFDGPTSFSVGDNNNVGGQIVFSTAKVGLRPTSLNSDRLEVDLQGIKVIGGVGGSQGTLRVDRIDSANSSFPIATFSDKGTERMRITPAGNVGIGTAAPNERLEIAGNLRLPPSTATTGVIQSGVDRFIHNFGSQNFFAGVNAGNLTMTGFSNTASGSSALQDNTIGIANTAIGTSALFSNTTGGQNTASGHQALRSNTTGDNNTASGQSALRINTTGHNNTASGESALRSNTTGSDNTASGVGALRSNTGGNNTASGRSALQDNTTGSNNTAIGFGANVSVGDLSNATAIGATAIVDASNKIRLGDTNVTVIEGNVAYTFPSDKTKKENFQPVVGEEVLKKIRNFSLTSWNYIGQEPKQFRHYGPMAQDFFAAFGNDGVGTIGTPTTINSGDMAGISMVAIKALEKRTVELKAENAELKARLERLEEMVKDRPYLTASVEPVLSKVEGPVP